MSMASRSARQTSRPPLLVAVLGSILWRRQYRLLPVCTIRRRLANHALTPVALLWGLGAARTQSPSMAAAGASVRYVRSRSCRPQVVGAGVAALGVSALAGGSFGLVRGTRAQSVGEPHPALATTSAGPNPWREPPVLMS